ncbi:MAG: hypothetical protein E6Q88_12720 [Lysobacteraceae bacterium]|nr:MAG: hypothetical protein E6Q88_12720 [Xanthomonadaceae bacterium]
MNRIFANLCLIMCVLYGLLLSVAALAFAMLLAISGFGYGDHSGREWWDIGVIIAYAVLMLVGLPACIGLLRRYLSSGAVALREASRWSWLGAAGTLFATVLLFVAALIALYMPGAGRSAGFGSFAFSMLLYPLGVVFPFLSSLRRSSRRAAP